MSFEAMTWAVGHRLPAQQKLVLMLLANRCNHDTGMCIPKIKSLADECGMSERSVQRALQDLEASGLIGIVRRTHEEVQLSNQYNLKLWVRGDLERKFAPPVSGSHPGCHTVTGGVSHSHPPVPHSHPRVSNWHTEPGIKPGTKPGTETNTPQPPETGGAGLTQASRFEDFWRLWPTHHRKTAKAQCAAKWQAKGCDAHADLILACLMASIASEAWRKQGGEYIPAPLVWLNQDRWQAPAPPAASEDDDTRPLTEAERWAMAAVPNLASRRPRKPAPPPATEFVEQLDARPEASSAPRVR